jgi:hypothetical protein
MVIQRRLSVRHMPYAKRCYGMTSKMKQSLRRCLNMLVSVGIGAATALMRKNRRGHQRYMDACGNLLRIFLDIMYVDIPPQIRAARVSRTIDSFGEAECYRRFRFRKPDLRNLFELLSFPATIIMENRSRLTGEEVFLFGLNRFTTCGFLEDLIVAYGGEISQWSRALHYFVG